MILLASLVVALALHILLGWPWSVLGGAVAGVLSPKSGWLVGSAAVGLSWSLLILYNFVVAPPETTRFLSITGGLFGNMSGTFVVVVTVLIGVVLGLLGGTIGGLARRFGEDLRSKQRS